MESVAVVEFFQKGGPLMWVLLALSVVAVAVILDRIVVYLSYGLWPDRWLRGLEDSLREGRIEEAGASAKNNPHPVARVVEAYLDNRNLPGKIRLEAVKRAGSLSLEKVEARIRVLAAIAHLSPLIGLLGTVIGMVVAFSQIQALQGTVKPGDLAGGIWEALLTTVFGLAVAIPSMAAFHAFESHADKIARRMEMAIGILDEVLDAGQADVSRAESLRIETSEDWSTVS